MSRAVDLRERLERSLGEMQESGAAEISELLSEMIHPSLDPEPSIRLETLKKEVYRVRLGSGQSIVLKRLEPATAQTDTSSWSAGFRRSASATAAPDC
jgi:hypothetical protein